MDEGTVRNRIRGYHESGFISGWRAVVNPTLYGGGEIDVAMKVGESVLMDELLEQIRLLPGILLIASLHGRGTSVVLSYHDESEAKREVDLLLRLARPDWRVVGRVMFPPCKVHLSQTDLAILRSIRIRPRKSAVHVARELGLSSRTVRRRLDRMRDEHAVFGFPALNPKVLKGTLMASLLVTYPSSRKAEIDAAVTDHLDEHLWHVFHMLPYIPGGFHPCVYNLFLPNLARAREILRWAHDLPGVAECRLELFEELETRFEVLDDEFKNGIFSELGWKGS